jgi:hypothetical protein
VKGEIKIPDGPAAKNVRIELSLRPGDGETVVVEPWPFGRASVKLRAEGKRLRGRYLTQNDLTRALGDGEPVLVTLVMFESRYL